MFDNRCIHSWRKRWSRRFLKLHALAGSFGKHQPALVQHADKVAQLFQLDLLRWELGFELVLDIVQAALAVDHLQDGVLFLLETEVVQPDRILDNPIRAALVTLASGDQVGPNAQCQPATGAGAKTVSQSGHE